MFAIAGIPTWWLLVAFAILATVVVLRVRLQNTEGVTAALELAARDLNGRLRATPHGRPSIDAEWNGVELELSFPPKPVKPAARQALRLRFRVPANTVDFCVSCREPSGDLLARGVLSATAVTDRTIQSRLGYLFRGLQGTDLVCTGGWAEITYDWPYTSLGVDSHELERPIRETWRLIELIIQKQSGHRSAA